MKARSIEAKGRAPIQETPLTERELTNEMLTAKIIEGETMQKEGWIYFMQL